MTGRTHDLAAVTTLTALVIISPLQPLSLATVLVSLAGSLIGGVAPDIDQPTAGLWHKIPAGSLFGHIISPLLGHHRMISHSLVGLVLAGLGMKYLLFYIHSFLLVDMDLVWWSFMLGFASHLVTDTITKEGVPWLFPLPIRFGFPPFIKFLRIQTGGWSENLLVFPGLLLLNSYLIYSHYSKFIDFLTHYITK